MKTTRRRQKRELIRDSSSAKERTDLMLQGCSSFQCSYINPTMSNQRTNKDETTAEDVHVAQQGYSRSG